MPSFIDRFRRKSPEREDDQIGAMLERNGILRDEDLERQVALQEAISGLDEKLFYGNPDSEGTSSETGSPELRLVRLRKSLTFANTIRNNVPSTLGRRSKETQALYEKISAKIEEAKLVIPLLEGRSREILLPLFGKARTELNAVMDNARENRENASLPFLEDNLLDVQREIRKGSELIERAKGYNIERQAAPGGPREIYDAFRDEIERARIFADNLKADIEQVEATNQRQEEIVRRTASVKNRIIGLQDLRRQAREAPDRIAYLDDIKGTLANRIRQAREVLVEMKPATTEEAVVLQDLRSETISGEDAITNLELRLRKERQLQGNLVSQKSELQRIISVAEAIRDTIDVSLLKERSEEARGVVEEVLAGQNATSEETRNIAQELVQLASEADDLARLIEQEIVEREATGFDEKKADRFGASEEIEEGDGLQHKGALLAKAKRLKRSRPFRAVMRMLQDGELRQTYDLAMSRKGEMLEGQQGEERHRAFAPMAAGLMLGERTRNLLDLAIDETVEDRSRRFKEQLRNASEKKEQLRFVPEVVIGSGVHGAIYAINREMVIPEAPSLTLERDSRIGGQFAQIQTDLFRLNSRTRPEERDMPYLPGTKQSLNTFTGFATTQPGDTGAESYQFQSALGEHARMNLFLSGEPIVNAEVRAVRKFRNAAPPFANYIVEFMDTETRRILEVATDRVVFTTGVGAEKSGLDESDITTKTILEDERKRLLEGKDARVMSFIEFTGRMGDASQPFPLKDMKRIIVSGEGDGGKVIAGILLGYEGQLGMSTATLDHVEEIIWIGQSFPDKETFLEECRARYHQLGLEFPRRDVESYYGRIKPVPNVRASELERVGDAIRVNGNNTENGLNYTVVGDHFIYSHGFEDRTDEIVAPLYAGLGDYRELTTKEKREQDLFFSKVTFASNINGIGTSTVIFFTETSDVARLEITPTPTGTSVLKVLRGGKTEVMSPADSSLSALYDSVVKDIDTVAYVETIFTGIPSAYAFTDPDGDAQIARKYSGEQVYKAGPASALPLTQQERRSDALDTIPENTAAVFRYAPNTARLAQVLAKEDRDNGRTGSALNAPELKLLKEKVLKYDFNSIKPFSQKLDLAQHEPVRVPFDMPITDLLRFGIASELEPYRFPEGIDSIKLSFSFDPKKAGAVTVASDYGVPSGYRTALKKALDNPHTLTALERMFRTTRARGKGMSLELPFERGKLDVANLGVRIG